MLGRTSGDLQLWAEPDQRSALVAPLEERGRVIEREVMFRVRSGEVQGAILSMVRITLDGEPCIVSLVRDIGAERRAVQQARDTAAALQRTLDLSLDLITTIDAQGRFLTVNAACQRLLGHTPEALIGRPYLDFVHPDDHARSLEGAALLSTVQELTTFQNRYLRRDGSVIWLDWTSVRLPDGVTYAIARDVTEQRAATEELAFLAAIVRASTDAIIGLALDGTVRSWNAGAERMYGYLASEMIGHPITEIVPPELVDEEIQMLARATVGAYTPSIETTRVSRLGHRLPVQLSIAPIFDAQGAVVGISKIAQDISARREAERQILQLNATLQRKLDHLTGLHEIDLSIASSLDLNVTLGLVLDQVLIQVRVDAAAALLLDTQTLTLDYAATRGFQTGSLKGAAVRLGEELEGRVALTRVPEVVDDLRFADASPAARARMDAEGFTALAAVPFIAKGKVLGVLQVLRQQPYEASSDWLETLQTLAGQAAIAIDSAQLFQELERSNLELNLAYQETIEGWARALDLRDKETEGHSRRVTELTVRLCRQLRVSAAELVHVQRGALLHDTGKMGIADAILLKPGPLTPEEWVEMRKHPEYAVELLAPIHFLQSAMDIPHAHHEKWDGTGYPRRLQGAAIPLTARAFAVVDVYDALTNARPYRAAWSRDRALTYIQEQAGTHFDPAIVQTFLALMERDDSGLR
ncbi:PAS domain S-box protein [Deinococcus ruber]|uniref:PAS domain S-box protein n=1 Tax=Deinococcus ruber TaxID=1848197 RepID=A0A918KX07_9DEIO|nr:PAS domain S-box protein [Deinococcus ruber]GGR38163.1 hypothetical protein GCM10008957_54210 [Deinococcus ruber]